MTYQKPSITDRQYAEADRSAGLVHLITGKTGKGEDFYAYLSIKPSRYEDFMLISRAHEEMNLLEFGDIIESGFGLLPPPEVRERMENRKDIDFEFLPKILRQSEKHVEKGERK